MDAFCTRILGNRAKGAKGLYQRGLLSLLGRCLETNDVTEITRRAYFTQMCKCSLPAGPSARINPSRRSTCVTKSLARELALLRDVPVLALGREVYELLLKMDLSERAIYVYHPSYYLMHSCRANHEIVPERVKQLMRANRS